MTPLTTLLTLLSLLPLLLQARPISLHPRSPSPRIIPDVSDYLSKYFANIGLQGLYDSFYPFDSKHDDFGDISFSSSPSASASASPSPSQTPIVKHYPSANVIPTPSLTPSSTPSSTPNSTSTPSPSSRSKPSWWADWDLKRISASQSPSLTPTPVTVTPVASATPTSSTVASPTPTPAFTGKNDGGNLWDSLFDVLSGRIRNALNSSDELWLSEE